jgi:hypothetical protein
MTRTNKLNLLLELLGEGVDGKDNLTKTESRDSDEQLSVKLDKLNTGIDKLSNLVRIATKDVLSIEEASIYSSLSISDLYHKSGSKIIKSYKPGKALFFRKEDLDRFRLSVSK